MPCRFWGTPCLIIDRHFVSVEQKGVQKWSRQAEFLHFADYAEFRKSSGRKQSRQKGVQKWSRQAEFLHFADYGKFMESPEKSSSGRRECKNGAARRNFCILPAMLNSWKARNAGRSAKKEPLGGIFAFCWLWRIHGKPRKTADRDNCPVSVCDENPTGRCFQIAAYSALIFPHLCGTPSSLFRFSFH